MLRRVIFSFLLPCVCSAVSLPAETLPDYVVTASRESEEALDVPATVAIITAAEIEASGKASVVQVLEDIAGVSFRSNSTEADAQVSMRGFGENSFGRVLVLVDGRKLNNPDMSGINWQSIQLSSIQRIEVLDGPSAVMYGSGAVGGVINIITKEKSDGLTAEATLSYGSFNTKRALLSGGYGSETAGILVSADIYRTDGYRDRSENDTTNVSVNGFIDVTDVLTVKPYVTYADIAYQMPGPLTEAQFDKDPTLAVNLNDDGREKDLGLGIAARLDATDRLSIELPVDYVHKNREANMASYWSPAYTDRGQHQFGARPKVSYSGESKIGAYRITGGLDYEGSLLAVETFSDEERDVSAYEFNVDQCTYAPYLALSVFLPHEFEASAGARYSATTIKAAKDDAITDGSAVTDIDESDSWRSFVYDAALNYRPNESLSFYARFNTLFRVPFVDEKAELTGYGDSFNSDLDPEKGWNAEIGAKYRLGDALTVGANAYYMMMTDEIAYELTDPVNYYYHNVNYGKTRRLGGALDLSYTPVKFATLSGNAALVNATFADGDSEDNRIPLVPSLTATGAVLFNLPFGLSVGTDVSYTGESYAAGDSANEADMIGDYALVGISAGFAPKREGNSLAIRFRMDNLLDTSYAPYVYYSSYGSSYYPATGRSFTVSVFYKY